MPELNRFPLPRWALIVIVGFLLVGLGFLLFPFFSGERLIDASETHLTSSTSSVATSRENGTTRDDRSSMFTEDGQLYDLPEDAERVSSQIEVPAILQNPELPTGCESVALTNTLLFWGFDLEKTTIADEWLPTSETDFVYSFLGNPRDPEANSCMAPCIAITANRYLEAEESEYQAFDISGSSFDSLLDMVAQGYPVIAWSTIDLVEVYEPYLTQVEDNFEYHLFTNSHCVVIAGYDEKSDTVRVSDSLAGSVAYDRMLLEQRYRELGSQAVLIF